jgi:CSLREA domain-containing protein
MSVRRTVSVLVVGAAVGICGGQAVAEANTLVVNSTADAVNADPGGGKCATAAGTCTLRAAVQAADAEPGASTIIVPAGRYVLTIPPVLPAGRGTVDLPDPNAGDLAITGTLTIKGAGPGKTIIDGNHLDRVFSVWYTGSASLSGMTVTGGDATSGGTNQEIDAGGGILNQGKITLDDMELVGNTADGGGGMFSFPTTVPVIENTLITDNQAFEGGGLRLDGGGTIINTTVTGNSLYPSLSPTQILKKPIYTVGPLVPEISGWGGGIDNRGTANLTIVNSTITDNHAIKGGGGFSTAQGYAPVSDDVALGQVTLRNTIIADNTSSAGPQQCRNNDVKIISLGDNIASDGSCFLTAKGDHPGTDPLLAPLANNGGPTWTQSLLHGSPAINGAGSCPATDQRGFPRPAVGPCDIGAYQHQPVVNGSRSRSSVRRHHRSARRHRRKSRTRRRGHAHARRRAPARSRP